MTRINNFHNSFRLHILQPSLSFGTERNKAFAGNHPTEASKRVHFITNDSPTGGASNDGLTEKDRAETAIRLGCIEKEKYLEATLKALKKALKDPSPMVQTAATFSILQLVRNGFDTSSCLEDISNKFDDDSKSPADPLHFLPMYTYMHQAFNLKVLNKNEFNELISDLQKIFPKVLENINERLQNGSEGDKELNSFYLRCFSQVESINDSTSSIIEALKSDNYFIVKNCLDALKHQVLTDPSSVKKTDIVSTLSDTYDKGGFKYEVISTLNEFARERILTQNAIPIFLKALKDTYPLTVMASFGALKKAHDNGLDISSAKEALTELTRSSYQFIKDSATELLAKISFTSN